jgi:hypothetical protein
VLPEGLGKFKNLSHRVYQLSMYIVNYVNCFDFVSILIQIKK